MKTNKAFKALFLLHLSILLFGSAGLFGKLIMTSPAIIVAGRLFFAFMSLLLFLILSKKLMLPDPKKLLLIVLSGMILALHWYSFFKSIQLSSVGVGLIYFSSYPLFTILIESGIFKKRINRISFITLLLTISGLILSYLARQPDRMSFIALVFGLISGITFSILSFLNRKLTTDYPVLSLSMFQFLVAFLCLIPVLLIGGIHDLKGTDYLLLLLLGVVFTAISHTLFINSLKYIPIASVSLISCLEPVYGIFLAFFIFGEVILPLQIVGAFLIITASIMEVRSQVNLSS